MRILIAVLIAADSLLLTLFSYVSRLYTEKGRFLIRGSKDNVDSFEELVEPQLKISPEEAERTFPLLTQLSVALLVLLTISWEIGRTLEWNVIVQDAAFVLFDVLFFAEVIPRALFARTAGVWLTGGTGLLRACILLAFPLVGIGQFLHHFTTSAEDESSDAEPPTPGENIEALMSAGEEEGLLEKDDRRLIRSVVEFGDKVVRDVMSPRPEIFAIAVETTLSQLKAMLATRRYSRIPVYQGDIDHVIGFVHARDLLPFSDAELASTTVRKLLRPLTLLPETKSVSEALKEIQEKKTQIAMVIDEYGSVAGVVTVEDMVEEIVGEIRDEHEPQDVIRQDAHSYSVPGNLALDRLKELFGVEMEETGDAATVSGFVTSVMGRVPAPGEVLERDGLRFEITEANGRRIGRMLIRAAEGAKKSKVRSQESEEERGGV